MRCRTDTRLVAAREAAIQEHEDIFEIGVPGCSTADALNCQRAVAAKVVARGGDYALALKGNQGSLHDDVRTFFDDPARPAEAFHTTVDGEHGRIETRTSLVSSGIGWLQDQHAWPSLTAIGCVVRSRETGTQTSTETAYYLLSPALSAARFGEVARAHWGVENSLHWVLDVTMNEDQARNHKDHGPQNLALLRRLTLNLAKLAWARSLDADAAALGHDAAALTGAGNFGAVDGLGAGIRVDVQHGSPSSWSGRQTLEPVGILRNSQPDRSPTMFRDLTAAGGSKGRGVSDLRRRLSRLRFLQIDVPLSWQRPVAAPAP